MPEKMNIPENMDFSLPARFAKAARRSWPDRQEQEKDQKYYIDPYTRVTLLCNIIYSPYAEK
jgi:hypothetical protein